MDAFEYDVIVVGAGLGGLSAGLHLQQQGLRVALLERLARVGGLCGTYRHHGHEFVIACNDFGLGIRKFCRTLDLPLHFRKCRTQVHYQGRMFTMPPGASTVLRLSRNSADIRAYLKALSNARADGCSRTPDLQSLVDGAVRAPEIRDLLKLPAYLMGITPSRFRVDALHDEFQFGYGYWQPMSPQGGPQHVADTLADQFVQRGGTLLLQTEYHGWEQMTGYKRIQTSRGELHCRNLVSTQEQPGYYPEHFERGLPISMCGLVLDAAFAFPKKVHTCIYYPPEISVWSEALYRGEFPREFGFHIFKSDLPINGSCFTANVYFYLPKGVQSLSTHEEKQLETYLLNRLEHILPGIRNAVKDLHFVLPDEFSVKHQLNGRVMPVITPSGLAKPGNYHAQLAMYFAGASAWPPGDHAGAALRSGQAVASLIKEMEKVSCV
jgi:phytoene dehydrogenase-like protein